MFKRVLIANRGEIAVRIVRALREMNIESVTVYSTADKDSLAAMTSTKSICIGPVNLKESYLDQERLIDVAQQMECDAIHPGYGFLSENAAFARKCEEAGITFIGPSWEIIQMMGDKQSAKDLMIKHGVPVVPGSDGLIDSVEEAKKTAARIGYPVIIKATAGGGGKGMRIVWEEAALEEELKKAQAEAAAAFANGAVYIEKYVQDPKHIEIQLLADRYGNVIHLGERNCSVQRKHQKILEESPSWNMTEELRSEMGMMAVKAAKAANYNSVGTVEFIMDRDGNYYFMEMNTRIQVEHPVTELLTGIDLIREQIHVAAGRKLELTQEDVSFRGHVMECRINARGTGRVNVLHFPEGFGVRTESALYEGCEITPFYDSMIAKIIVSDRTRIEAIRRMRRCLEELVIEGVATNIGELYMILHHPVFVSGDYDTSFIEKHGSELVNENW